MPRPTTLGGVTVTVRVVPRAAKPSIAVDPDGRLRARLHSPPVDGAANDELVAMLARTFDLPRRAVAVVGGAQGRTKRIRLEGIDERRVAAVLAGLPIRAV